MGWDYSYLSVRKAGDKFILQQAVCKDAEQQNPEQVKKELARLSGRISEDAGCCR